ncbi:hypothetical protein [Halalkalibacter alkaliphilus]|uniref:Uncharacterized protein n=1 Tax=Halalkalibacter alkaliphilus TaxID=2917993 RepID=A0A9X2CVX4_9BACI|nr:hypothetical protein [Halalkalibacter alkaliphilus]MCL7749218.1 hypothetical protein [Halalkalibacter alkaliphilus]
MKTQFDERLKQIDDDIQWNKQRNQKVKNEIIAEIEKHERKPSILKHTLIYSSSLIAFAIFAFLIVVNITPINESQRPSDEEITNPILDEDVMEEENEWIESDNELDIEDGVKMTEDRSTWTEEEMLNDLSAGIILTHRQLTKFVEGEWVPDYHSAEDQQIISDLFSYVSRAGTAAFHLSADNYLYVDLMNLNSVLGEAFQNQDDDGLLLAYQVVHDLDVAYNGFEEDKGPFGVTLYRDATYDVVRTYLGRQ